MKRKDSYYMYTHLKVGKNRTGTSPNAAPGDKKFHRPDRKQPNFHKILS
jgi:hypothetical protein